MIKGKIITLILVVLCVGWVMAEDKPMEMMTEMPPMGAPEQMKNLAYLEGTWDAAGMMRMEPGADEIPYKGEITYKYMFDGGTMFSEYKGDMMGTPFIGYAYQCWDSEKEEWQFLWMDDASCRMVLYTGNTVDGETIFKGTNVWQGKKYFQKMTIWDETDTSYEWSMEESLDGENWWTSLRATYTKRVPKHIKGVKKN